MTLRRDADYEAVTTHGSVTVNCEPRPTPALSAVTLPPCSSTRFFTIPNPKPVEPSESALRKGWETGGRKAGMMAMAVTVTTTTVDVSLHVTETRTRPPAAVNFTAFDSRLTTTWRSRAASPRTRQGGRH